jgi:hypothetical protein
MKEFTEIFGVYLPYIRPALARAGIKDKVIGWHSFRHGVAEACRQIGVDQGKTGCAE